MTNETKSTELVLLKDAVQPLPVLGSFIEGECFICFTPCSCMVTPRVLIQRGRFRLYCSSLCSRIAQARFGSVQRGLNSSSKRQASVSPFRGPRLAPVDNVWVSGVCTESKCNNVWTKPTETRNVKFVSGFCSQGCALRHTKKESQRESVDRNKTLASAYAASLEFKRKKQCPRPKKAAYPMTPKGMHDAQEHLKSLQRKDGALDVRVYKCKCKHYHVGHDRQEFVSRVKVALNK